MWYSFAKRGKRIKLMKIVRRKPVVLKHKLADLADYGFNRLGFSHLDKVRQLAKEVPKSYKIQI